MGRRHSDVLYGAIFVRYANPLDRPAIFQLAATKVQSEPCRLGQKTILQTDLVHQTLTAIELGEALEDVGIDFVAKAEILGFGMAGEQAGLPGEQAITVGNVDRDRSVS